MDVIERYLEEVLVANETTNLTRIVSRESAEILHIEDSLSGLNYINEAPGGPYVDLGTGGGFPGVPLAVKTGRDTLLVDSVKKKTQSYKGLWTSWASATFPPMRGVLRIWVEKCPLILLSPRRALFRSFLL